MPTNTSTAPEFLILVKESAYGTPFASPVAGTDLIQIRLVDSNSFSAVAEGQQQEIPYGGGFDIAADVICDNYTVTGSLKTLLYPSQAAFLLNWGLTRVNAGLTAPWAQTSEPAGDLASVTAYHAIRRRDGTWKYRELPGGKVLSGKLTVSRQNPKCMLEFGVQFQKEIGNPVDASADLTSATFPLPLETGYPTGPYLFSHTAGYLLFGGSALTQYESVELAWTNKFDPCWFESKWLSILGCHGRDTTLDASLLLKASPDMRSLYLNLTTEAASLEFNNGTHTATVSLNGQNYLTKVPYDLQLGKEFKQPITIKNRWDATAVADVTVTTT